MMKELASYVSTEYTMKIELGPDELNRFSREVVAMESFAGTGDACPKHMCFKPH